MTVRIQTRQEYDQLIMEGYQPLMSEILDFDLRIQIQKEFQCKNKSNHSKFYRWCWENIAEVNGQVCEECSRYLTEYSAVFISHILSKGSHPEMKHDPRNINILCMAHHNEWEFGERKSMKIWPQNCLKIESLKREYQQYW